MTRPETTIRLSVGNESLGLQGALFRGVKGSREWLAERGFDGGYDWTPLVRSRLYAEILLLEALGSFQNNQEEGRLIGPLSQSYAPTVGEAVERYRDRLHAGEMSWPEATKRLACNIFEQRGTKPTVMGSLASLGRMARVMRDRHTFAKLYPEELEPGASYTDMELPFMPVAHLSPDTAEKMNLRILDFPEQLALRGIQRFAFSTFHSQRRSQSGRTSLPSWTEYLPIFAEGGLIRQFIVGLSDSALPATIGQEARRNARTLRQELTSDNPRELGELSNQLGTIIQSWPATEPITLDVTVSDKELWRLDTGQVRNITTNLRKIIDHSLAT